MAERSLLGLTDPYPASRQSPMPVIRALSAVSHCLVAGSLVLSLSVRPVEANPQGGKVTAGSATITEQGARLNVNQHTQKAIIDWRGFDIAPGEHTNFNQPSRSAVALNRVRSASRSLVDGRLTANGRVFLVNPNGVIFGRNAQVSVGGLIASTADIRDRDFLAGDYRFSQASTNPDASVTNLGRIEVHDGGLAILAAPAVHNAGLIRARLGRVTLAGANTFTVDFEGDGLLSFEIGSEVTAVPHGEDGEPVATLVANSGQISADGGVVALTARAADSIIDQVINMDGVIEARAVSTHGGTIVLHGGDTGIVSVAGTLDASGTQPGQSGGTVKVLGEKVGLFDGARVSASGDAGGGEVLVGGNYKGGGPEPNARRTYVAQGAAIDADALEAGDGGRVIVWADEDTYYYGDISVQGGAGGGDGGFVEVSGKKHLAFRGDVAVGAPNGQGGSLLLDPQNLTIQGGTGDGDGNEDDLSFYGGSAFGEILAGDPVDVVFESELEGIFRDGGSIVLEAVESIGLAGTFENDDVVLQPGVNLTLRVTGDPDVPGLVPVIDLTRDDGRPLTFVTQGGAFTVSGNASIGTEIKVDTGGGDITFSGAVDGPGGLGLTAGDGSISVSGNIGGVEPLAALSTSGASIILQDVTTSGSQNYTGPVSLSSVYVSQDGRFDVVGDTTLESDTTISAEAGISFSGTVNSGLDVTSDLTATAGSGNVAFGAEVGNTARLGNLTVSGFNVSVREVVTDNGQSYNATVGSIQVNGQLTDIFGGGVTLAGPGATTILSAGIQTSGDPIVIDDAVVLAAPVLLSTTGGEQSSGADIRLGGPVDGSNDLTLNAGSGGVVTLTGDVGGLTPLTQLNVNAQSVSLTGDVFAETQSYVANVSVEAAETTLAGDEIDFNGGDSSVSGPGNNLTLQPLTPGQSIIVGGAEDAGNATLDLTSSDVGALNNGFAELIISEVVGDDIGSVEVEAITFIDPVTIVGDSITVNGTLQGIGDASVTLRGPGSTTTLNADIVTSGDPIVIDDAVIVAAPVLLATTGGEQSAGANISLGSTVDGSNDLSLDAGTGGVVTFTGDVGVGTPLTNLDVDAQTASLGGDVRAGTQTYDAAVSIDNAAVTLAGDEIDFNGGADSVNGPGGVLTLQPLTLDQSVIVGGAEDTGDATLDLTSSDVGALSDGFAELIISEVVGDDVGSVDIEGVTFTDPVTIGGDSIAVNGTLIGDDNASVTLEGPGSTTALNADIVTSGNDITIRDAVIVQAPMVLLSTTGGEAGGADIILDGTVDGVSGNALTLEAGVGDVRFNSDVGARTPLGAVVVNGANNLRMNGLFIAGDVDVLYAGDFTTVNPSLNVSSLEIFFDQNPDSATLFGTVAGASGPAAALAVDGPIGDPNFTINGCIIGVVCVTEPPLPPQVEPHPPPFGQPTPVIVEVPAPFSIGDAYSASEDPRDVQFSNLGHEEQWVAAQQSPATGEEGAEQ